MTLSFDPDTFAPAARHFIGGAAVTETPGMALRRPSDGAALADAPVAGVEIVDRAVETAQRALRSSGWGTSPPRERTRALHRASRPGAFFRVDIPEASGLGDWLAAQGLAPVGGGTVMIRGGAPAAASEFQSFALAAPALG